jgi:monothiol glutaredoxin
VSRIETGTGEGDETMVDVQQAIEREVREHPVVVYMKGTPSFPMCGFSAAVVEILREVGVPFKAVDILAEADKREAVKAYTSWPTIPQIFVRGKFIGGCDIVRQMHAKGELAPLLKQAPVSQA